MNPTFLESITLVLSGQSIVVQRAEKLLRQYAPALVRESVRANTDGSMAVAYRIPMRINANASSESLRWKHWANDAVVKIEGLSIVIDICNDELLWERLALRGDEVGRLCAFLLPLYPRVFSLYADACLDIERLANRMTDLRSALGELSNEVSLIDDYNLLFPDYALIDFDAYLDDSDNWDEEDFALDNERALAEQVYGGWWHTWKNGDDGNIEKLHSGKCLISIVGQLRDSHYADMLLAWGNDLELLSWIEDFVRLVDKHHLWFEDDDVRTIRLAVAWCEAVKMQRLI